MAQNFFDQFDGAGAPGITVKQGDPYARPSAAAKLQKDQIDAANAAAMSGDIRRKTRADADAAEAAARKARDEAAQAEATRKALDADKASVRQEALDKIRLARSLQQRSRDGWFTTGIGAGVARQFGGTGAYDVSQDTDTLKNAGALTRIMEMAKANGGKNPLTPLSNADFQALSSSLANLDTSQSDEQYQRNVQRVIDLYTRAYQGAGGSDLEGDLDPSKRRRQEVPGAGRGQQGGGGAPLPPSGPPGMDRSTGFSTDMPSDDTMSVANGAYRMERDRAVEARVDAMIRAGRPDSEINGYLTSMGRSPATNLAAARDYLRRNPGYSGGFTQALSPVENSWTERAAASPAASFITNVGNAGTAGYLDEIGGIASAGFGGDYSEARDAIDWRKNALSAANPKSAFAGTLVGSVGSLAAGGAGVGRVAPGMVTRLGRAAPFVGDLAYGATYGAGENNADRLTGAGIGGGLSVAGGAAGRTLAIPAGAAIRSAPVRGAVGAVRSMVGRPALPAPPVPLNQGQRMVVDAANRAGPDNIRDVLQQARALNLPISLADTHPQMRSLAGAAIRRSPNAREMAEQTLLPRGRGQFDRLQTALDRDTVPGVNIPQQSEALIRQARAASAPLYGAAFNAPGASAVRLDDLMQRPGFQRGLERARGLAAEEGVDPTSLGFDFDQMGNVVLTRVPSFRTLDYVKRGLDDEIYGNTDAFGRPVMTDATRALEGTRAELVRRLDAVNSDYSAARAAYAGPAREREAFQMGTQAINQAPDNIAFTMQNYTPQQQGQYRLGYRSELDNRLGNIRYAQNPWETAFGSPNARERLNVLFPRGAPRFGQHYDLETRMAQTQRDLLGNSMTAERQIADQSFGMSPGAAAAIDLASNVATGSPPLLSMLRLGAQHGRDALRMGVGRNRADAVAPMLLDTNPALAAANLDGLINLSDAYRSYVAASRPTRRMGMFGASTAAALSQ